MKMKELVNSKKHAIAVICFIAAIFLATQSAYAWFRSNNAKINEFQAGLIGFDVEIEEVFTKPTNPSTPMTKIAKIVTAKNIGNQSAFIRIRVTPTIIASDGSTPLPSQLFKDVKLYDSNDNLITDSAEWNANWKYYDGYFYYLNALDAKAVTPHLFDSVIITTQISAERPNEIPFNYYNSTAKIDVAVESVSASSLGYRKTWWGLDAATAPTSPVEILEIDTKLKGLI